MNNRLSKLLYKIKNCARYEYLYKLEEDFNSVGLTLQRTVNDSMILCKIVDSKPCTDEIMEDYIFVGSLNERKYELSDRMMDVVTDFVMNSAGDSVKVDYSPRKWQNGVLTYGRIMVVNEGIDKAVQTMTEDEWPTSGISTIID